VPRGHLDDEGKRAFLRGFFSGDGCVSEPEKGGVKIWFYSKSKSGLEELHQTLKDLGFHPLEIIERKKRKGEVIYGFMISAKEHIKFIEEIGSYKPRHMQIFEKMKRKKTGGG
jgi:intein/homing endonuclease